MAGSPRHGIVVGVDGSETSTAAVAWAAREAVRRDVPLSIVHVLPSRATPAWPDFPFSNVLAARDETRARMLLQAAERVAELSVGNLGPIALSCTTLTGHATATLVSLSEDAAMVVVGRSGDSVPYRRFLGSVAAGLVHHARCAVAVVPGDDLGAGAHEFPILLGVDGPPAGESSIAIAFDEASLRGVDLVALHVWALTDVHRFDASERQRLISVGEAALRARLAHWQSCYPDVRVDRRLLFGEPAHLLVEASGSAQLTVVGSHGGGGFAEMLLGSVSSEVVRSARTPVIVMRAK